MSLPLWVKRCSAKSKKSANAKKLFYVHLDNVVLNFTEFEKYLIGRVKSFRSWSSHLFRGRPGGRRHVRSGGRLSDTLIVVVY